MDFYQITLKGMYQVLDRYNEKKYADIISDCIEKWNTKKDTYCFLKEFAQDGRFRKFQFNIIDFDSEEQNFWAQQLFGGLVAMAIKLADSILEKEEVSIEYIKRNFGQPAQVITGTMCTKCGQRQMSQLDIDKYVSLQIIAKKIVQGLENDTLDKNIDEILSFSAPEIKRERESARLRAVNSSIPISHGYSPLPLCLHCGNKQLVTCRFLKSLKENKFVPLKK